MSSPNFAGIADVLGPEGALAREFDSFMPREGQLAMAERVAKALAAREVLLVEAGTGIGKTFAYLVPALLSGRRVLISTGTRALQDQLYHRDLPRLAGAMGRPVRVALLKGRTNYLCRLRLEQSEVQPSLLPGAERFESIREWAAMTRSGDLAEIPELGDAHPLRLALSATREQCLGARCARFSACHVFEARRQALEADVVVVNHHLLLADLALREEGFGELLPSVEALILDEAHQLPDLTAEFFGERLGSRQLEVLAQDARRELALGGCESAQISRIGAALERPLADLAAQMGRQERRIDWAELPAPLRSALSGLTDALQDFSAQVESSGNSAAHQQLCVRARQLAGAMSLIADTAGTDGARSVAISPRGFAATLLPYDVSERFRSLLLQHPAAWIFTSATLAVGEDFSHFASRLGLGEAATLRIDSPFDYPHLGLVYLPPALPDQGAPGYTAALIEAALPLLQASGGGAFLLFTSHRALGEAARILRGCTLPGTGLMVQGEEPREQLLRRFRLQGHAILLGTASFWEGVDVQGPALRLVIIDKLPFVAPDDPVVRARIEYLRRQGGNPFRDFQLPEAVLALKQGVGRLIRSERDRGVVLLADPRIRSRSYGRSFLRALPPLPVTQDLAAVVALLRTLSGDSIDAALAEAERA